MKHMIILIRAEKLFDYLNLLNHKLKYVERVFNHSY